MDFHPLHINSHQHNDRVQQSHHETQGLGHNPITIVNVSCACYHVLVMIICSMLTRLTDNSAASGLQVHTLLNHDETPPRNSIPSTPQSARLPVSAISTTSTLPSINQGFHDNTNRGSLEFPPSLDSRRSSVDSRVQQFSNLYINNPASPYDNSAANGSQVSLAASLRRPNGQTPLSPLSGRASGSGSIRGLPAAPRQAPPIMPAGGRMPGGPDPTAAKPTAGFAWAFPDQGIPEERRASDSGDSSISIGPSRANSFAASSVRSSVFSTDSQMPMGQRRFDDGMWTRCLLSCSGPKTNSI